MDTLDNFNIISFLFSSLAINYQAFYGPLGKYLLNTQRAIGNTPLIHIDKASNPTGMDQKPEPINVLLRKVLTCLCYIWFDLVFLCI